MKNYQKALDDMKRHIVGIPVLGWYYTKDADLLQKLVDEKFEFESRKDNLIADSKWECVGECYGDGAFLKRNEVVTFVRKTGKFDVVLIEKENGNDTYMPTQQFLLCFKPIRIGKTNE